MSKLDVYFEGSNTPPQSSGTRRLDVFMSDTPRSPAPEILPPAPVPTQSVPDSVGVMDVVKEIPGTLMRPVRGVMDAMSRQSARSDEAAYKMSLRTTFDPSAKEKLRVYDTLTPEQKTQAIREQQAKAPVMRALNSETGKKVTGAIYNTTNDAGLKVDAAIRSMGDQTYDEAFKALKAKSVDPTNNTWEKLRFGLETSGVQSAIGALLSVGASVATKNPVVGRAVAAGYFAPISAEGQRMEKGSVTSLGNIAVDTVGDTILSGFAETALKSVATQAAKGVVKNFAINFGKGFTVEGSTEVTQTFLKYANDYTNARTQAEKGTVIDSLVQYIKEGGMLNEFLVGGVSGGLITGGAGLMGSAVNPNLIPGQALKDTEVPPSTPPAPPNAPQEDAVVEPSGAPTAEEETQAPFSEGQPVTFVDQEGTETGATVVAITPEGVVAQTSASPEPTVFPHGQYEVIPEAPAVTPPPTPKPTKAEKVKSPKVVSTKEEPLPKRVYRGGTTLSDAEITDKGISFSTDRKVAEEFTKMPPGGEGGRNNKNDRTVFENFISPNAKIATIKDIPSKLLDEHRKTAFPSNDKVFKWVRENGYDGVDLSGFPHQLGKMEKEIRIFNKKVIIDSTPKKTGMPTPAELAAIKAPAVEKYAAQGENTLWTNKLGLEKDNDVSKLKEGDAVTFDGKQWTVKTVLKMKGGDTKFELVPAKVLPAKPAPLAGQKAKVPKPKVESTKEDPLPVPSGQDAPTPKGMIRNVTVPRAGIAKPTSSQVYRGGELREAGGGEQDFGQGYYFAENLSTAKGYGDVKAYSIFLKNPLTVKDRYEMNGVWDDYLGTKPSDEMTLRDWLKSKGYDGILVKDGGMGSEKGVGGFLIAFDKSSITELGISEKSPAGKRVEGAMPSLPAKPAPLAGQKAKPKTIKRSPELQQAIHEQKLLIEFAQSAIIANDGSKLGRFMATRGEFKGELPEEFSKRADYTQWGFNTLDEARKGWKDYIIQKERLQELKDQLKEMRTPGYVLAERAKPAKLTPMGKNELYFSRDGAKMGEMATEKTDLQELFNVGDMDEIGEIIARHYGGKIPVVHATTQANAEKIRKEGLVTQKNGKNYVDWGYVPDNFYLQIGKSDYVDGERSVLFEGSVSPDWFMMHAEADRDGITITEKQFKEETGLDLEEIEIAPVRDMVLAYYQNGQSWDGLELLITAEEGESVGLKMTEKLDDSTLLSKGSAKLDNFEERIGTKTAEPNKETFKLYEKVQGLVAKYADRVGEGYVAKGAAGHFNHVTKNIRLQGMNQLSVAAHEITHSLDIFNKITDDIMKKTGETKDGKPIYDPKTASLRKELTALYLAHYPGGKKTHSLKLRMIEGYATLLQKYTEAPKTITQNYPNVVREFLTQGGQFYRPVIGEIVSDLQGIVTDYQALSALDKIGASVTSDLNPTGKDSFLTTSEMVKTEVLDEVFPLSKLGKMAGINMTGEDPGLLVRMFKNVGGNFSTNTIGDDGYWAFNLGFGFKKAHDFNWKTLMQKLEKDQTLDDYGNYLVARDQHFNYIELDQLKGDAQLAVAQVKNPNYMMGLDLKEQQEAIKHAQEVTREYEALQKQVDNNNFTRSEVDEAYEMNKDKFVEEDKMFDALVHEDLKLMHEVGLVSDERYEKLSNKEGYATMRREFYDQLVGDEGPGGRGTAGAKPSALKGRFGSKRTIINPIYGSIKNHSEALSKGLAQVVKNRIVEIARTNQFGGLMEIQKLDRRPNGDGTFSYPQDMDKNILMGYENGVRVPVLMDGYLHKTLTELLDHQSVHAFERMMRGTSRLFTKSTTGLFPGFALTNFSIDQITAWAQTKQGYIPIVSPLRELGKVMMDKTSKEAEYFREYIALGGTRQTLTRWQDMSARELAETIAREKQGIDKYIQTLERGSEILALPATYSELMTRSVEYVKSRKAGDSQIVAMEKAGMITGPFHHIGRLGGGTIGKTVVRSFPFFNPVMQALSQTYESGFRSGPKASARMAVVQVALIAAAISGLMAVMGLGSDDQKEQYKDIPPDELERYLWFPSPDGKTLLKFRAPDQLMMVPTLINMAIADRMMGTAYTTKEQIEATLAWVPAQFNPMLGGRMITNLLLPQLIKPAVMTALGIKDYPKIGPIVSAGMKYKPETEQYYESTPLVTKAFAQQFGLSPLKVDYLITGYFGRASGFVLGKPGIFNPFKVMSREYYVTSGRRLKHFYEVQEDVNQQYTMYNKDRKSVPKGEVATMLRTHQKVKAIDKLIDIFGDMPDQDTPQARLIRDKILKQIEQLD